MWRGTFITKFVLQATLGEILLHFAEPLLTIFLFNPILHHLSLKALQLDCPGL